MFEPGTSSHKIRTIELELQAAEAKAAWQENPTPENMLRWQDALERQTEFSNRPHRKT